MVLGDVGPLSSASHPIGAAEPVKHRNTSENPDRLGGRRGGLWGKQHLLSVWIEA